MTLKKLTTAIKKLILFTLTLCLVTSSMNLITSPLVSASKANLFTKEFVDPSNPNRSIMRLWMPLAPIDEEELRFALTDIAKSGFGGVEIGAFPVPGEALSKNGWNSDAWNSAMKQALKIAAEPDINLRVDFMVTANYPTATPATYVTPDEEGAEKELAWGAVEIKDGQTFNRPAPSPIKAPAEDVKKQELVAIVAAKLLPGQDFAGANLGASTAKTLKLDMESTKVLELPETSSDPIVFEAPEGEGDWVLTSYWLRGSGVKVADITEPNSYVIDHLSTVGTHAWTRLWEDEILADKETRKLIAKNGGYLFEDSLHLESYQLWTNDFFDEFKARRGYDVTPYLPTLLIPDLNKYFSRGTRNADTTLGTFEYEPGVGQKIRNDYYQTLTDLYIENHITPMREWAKQFGLGLRYQPSYGQTLEQSAAVFELDIPETESFQHGNQTDAYRYISSAAHASDKPIISTECCAERNQTNALGWQSTLPLVENNFAGGVNNIVFHGYSYNISPNATWPGWIRFGQNSFSENYGKQPTWQNVKTVSDFLGRVQTVLREGRQITDVAVYRHSYWDQISGGSFYYKDGSALTSAGYSYGFVSPAMLDLKNFTVSKKRLDPEGAGYRALIIDEGETLPLSTAKKLLELAKTGFPIIFVGTPPTESPFFKESSADIKGIVSRILDTDAGINVVHKESVPAILEGLKVIPDAQPSSKTTALPVRRSTESENYYYLFNKSTTPLSMEYSFAGNGKPYFLDAWSGEITPIAEYTEKNGSVKVRVELKGNESTIIGITNESGNNKIERLPSVESTTGSKAVINGNSIAILSEKEGVMTTKLSDGKTITVTSDNVPSASLGTIWDLEVESWEQASGTDPYTIAKIPKKTTVRLADDGTLPSWTSIPGLEDVSGIGNYVGRLLVSNNWAKDSGLVLDLGKVYDTVNVKINGKEVNPFSPLNPRVDVSNYIHSGENRVEITVATTMRNRMRVISGPAATPSSQPRQDYGIFGPVTLTTYQKVVLKPKMAKGEN
jgi:hypothetical protein